MSDPTAVMETARPEPVRQPQRGRSDRTSAIVVIAIACLPIVVATVRALLHHWTPIGDDGLLAIRAQDLFSRHVPLLGTASSASFLATKPLNNPGPLYFYLVGLPVAAFGSAVGTAVGAAAVNLAAVIAIGVIGWRRAGLLGTALAMLVASTLAWSMGSELLYDIWQPHGLLLPFLAFLFLIWSVAVADWPVFPVAIFAGSLLMQTHLTYGYLTPLLVIAGLMLGLGQSPRQRRHDSDEAGAQFAATTGGAGRWIVIGVLVGLLAWTPSLIEQVTMSDGNMSRLVRQIQDPPKGVVGGTGALRLTATVLAQPPFWGRDSFPDTFRPAGTPYGATAPTVDGTGAVGSRYAALAIGLVILLLVSVGLIAWRRRNASGLAATAVALVVLAGSWYTASKVTVDIVGVAPHQFRFLWSMAAFVTFVIALGLVQMSRVPAVGRWARVLAIALVGVMSVWNLPTYAATVGPQLEAASIPTIRDLDRQLGPAERSQPLLLDFTKLRFGEPFSGALMSELRRRDIELVTDDVYLARQLGPTRATNGHDAKVKIFYRSGDIARAKTIGVFTRIAFHEGLDARDARRLDGLKRLVGDYLARNGLPSTPRLESGEKIGVFSNLRGPFTTETARAAVFDSRQLVFAVDQHVLALPARWNAKFEEYARLQTRDDRETIGVYVGPVDATDPP